MNVEVTLWFSAAILVFGTTNLVIAAVLLRRHTPAPAVSAPPVLDVLARALIALVVMAALITDVELILPSAPAIGRPALYIIGALLIEVLKRLFAVLPNAPRWLPRLLRSLEFLLLLLAVIGLVLTVLVRRV
ncbi:MAG TPA: hypothetical protein VKE23_08145 [Candidatus Limnocylindria bacterium]|nr:hypothetical protein [Candidatus Limnocylindria bacterium]